MQHRGALKRVRPFPTAVLNVFLVHLLNICQKLKALNHSGNTGKKTDSNNNNGSIQNCSTHLLFPTQVC